MEIINRTDEFWMEFFDPTDAYEDLYVDEKMIIKGIFDNMGIHHKYVFKFESLEEIYPYIHGRIYAYKNLKEVDFKSIFYEKYNTDSFFAIYQQLHTKIWKSIFDKGRYIFYQIRYK